MSKIYGGGPIFPVKVVNREGDEITDPVSGDTVPVGKAFEYFGMSLRDWFAGQAMNAYCKKPYPYSTDYADTARWAYEQADAMLAARSQEQS